MPISPISPARCLVGCARRARKRGAPSTHPTEPARARCCCRAGCPTLAASPPRSQLSCGRAAAAQTGRGLSLRPPGRKRSHQWRSSRRMQGRPSSHPNRCYESLNGRSAARQKHRFRQDYPIQMPRDTQAVANGDKRRRGAVRATAGAGFLVQRPPVLRCHHLLQPAGRVILVGVPSQMQLTADNCRSLPISVALDQGAEIRPGGVALADLVGDRRNAGLAAHSPKYRGSFSATQNAA